MKRHLPLFILFVLLCVIGVWSWTAQPWKDWMHRGQDENTVVLDRYDRVLDEYVSLGSYTALHRMNTQYPMQTKLLIEDVLKLGVVNEPDVEQRLRHYYLDSTVQVLLDEVHRQYNDMSDIEADLNRAFEELRKEDPQMQKDVAGMLKQLAVSSTGVLKDGILQHRDTPEEQEQS